MYFAPLYNDSQTNGAPSILDAIGLYGPLILLCTAMLKLAKRPIFLTGYLVFLVLNTILNFLLKTSFKQPRPSGRENYFGPDKYGMPSGHAQSVFFSTSYLFFATTSVELLILESFICLLTVYQRWKYKQHTAEQLFWGAITGTTMGYLGNIATTRYCRE